jgi:regulator of RNase E activity RraA
MYCAMLITMMILYIIYRVKTINERTTVNASKFLYLDTIHGYDELGAIKPEGDLKGMLQSVDIAGPAITLTCQNGDQMVLKVSRV